MDWGNAIVRKIYRDNNADVNRIDMDLHLAGDFKATEKKFTWLSKSSVAHELVNILLLDYDYLVQKRKLEKDDTVRDIANWNTEFKLDALADANILELQVGDIIQFERKGYFILDKISEESGEKRFEFIHIPDGRAAGLALKAPGDAAAPVTSKKVDSGPTDDIYKRVNMYQVQPVCPIEAIRTSTNMYKVDNVYDSKN